MRKCELTLHENGQPKKVNGNFLWWGNTFEEFENGAVPQTVAIVELADGSVVETAPSGVRFIDGLKVKVNPHGNPMPEHIEGGDWIDLRAAETVKMKKGDFKIISLGVSMQLPEGYEAHIVPRSSTFTQYGVLLTNSFGIIDNSYSGDNDVWAFPALAMRNTVINKGDRICQFRAMKKQERLRFVSVDKLGNKNRGGFGSTGVK